MTNITITAIEFFMQRTHDILPKKTGILIVNLGSPEQPTASAVKKFLAEFLSDQRVIPLPKILWRTILYGIILPIRSKKVAQKYKTIWQKQSPLHLYTDNIAKKLQKKLSKNHIVLSAYRYGKQPIEGAIKTLMAQGCRRILVLPLYPQYSSTTTASVVDEIGRIQKKLQHQPTINIVPPYFDHPLFINLLKKSIIRHGGKKLPDRIIISNHGIPMATVMKGDPYSCQAKKTARLLRTAMKLNPDRMPIAFQSRFGRAEWVKPYAIDLVRQARDEINHLAIIAPSFAVDCLETLEEINLELRKEFLYNGSVHKTFTYIPCLNDTKEAIDFYHQILTPFM